MKKLSGNQKLVFKISDDNPDDVTVEAVGFFGVGCREATAPFEAALGNVTDRTAKAVMWSATASEATHIQMGTKS